MYPLIMQAYGDFAAGSLPKADLLQTVLYVQALLLRRTVSGLSNDRLVARLCRARANGGDALDRAVSRITPSDERVRVGLKYSDLPHPAYVLSRLAGVANPADLELEYIFPLAPGDAWTGDGSRAWSEYSEDEQNSHRALAKTLGNLTPLEEGLAERAADRSFPEKRDAVYPRSAVS